MKETNKSLLEKSIDYLENIPNVAKLSFILVALGLWLYGVITDKDWAIRWTNTARAGMIIELLGRKGFRILNGIMIIIAMISITYLYIGKGL